MSRSRHVVWGSLLAALLLVVAAACGSDDSNSDSAASEEAATQAVVIDSDMSVEGAMSILYLLSHPDVSVEAITISGTGLVSCAAGTEQALGLLELVESDDIPVACGPDQPLDGDNEFPAEFRAAADSLHGVTLPAGGEASDTPAPDLLASVIADADEPVSIYADGPLTNVALALEEHPDMVENISGITFMGGAIDVAGNTFDNPKAEWNVWVDPVATERVLASGVPVTMVPLNATNTVPLTSLHAEALVQHTANPAAEMVGELVAAISATADGNPVSFWDQLAATVLTDPSVVTLENHPIVVVSAGGPGSIGTTRTDDDGSTVSVAMDADREAFERTYFSTVLGEAFESIDLSPDITVSFDGEWSYDAPAEMPLGPAVVEFENGSGQGAIAAILWLLDDATLEDLEAWGSVEQPPFVELAGIVFADSGTTETAVLELTHVGMNIVVGLTFAPDSTTRLTTFDVE